MGLEQKLWEPSILLFLHRLITDPHCNKPKCKEVYCELQEKNAENARLKAEPCMKLNCAKLSAEKNAVVLELSQLKSESCTNTVCRETLSKYAELQIELSQVRCDLEQKKVKLQLLEERRNEEERLQSKLQQLIESNQHFQEQIIGTLTNDNGETITFSEVLVRIFHLQQQQLKGCVVCSDMEMRFKKLQRTHEQLKKQHHDDLRTKEETIQGLNERLYSQQCQRPECEKLRKEQRQKEVQQMGKMGNPGKEVDKQCTVEHDQLIHEFERLTTDLDGLLGVLENTLQEYGDEASFEAKKLLCALFQKSYDNCRTVVIQGISTELESLFRKHSERTEKMEDASRGYGLLLHAFGLRTEPVRAQHFAKIKTKICCNISNDETLQKVKEKLVSSQEDYLGKVIELAWKFVTLPDPLIVCQPESFNHRIHSQEFGHWEKHTKDSGLIYTRPVVYRSYEGELASKGWVANTTTTQQRGWDSKCLLS